MTSKRILLTTSATPQQSPFSTAEKRMPIGIGYLISVLREAGHEVFFIDNYLEKSDFLETGFLIDNKIDYIGIYANTICFRDTLRMLKKLQHLRSTRQWSGKIMLGGPHTTVASETIPDFVDFVVQGEGERAIVDIVNGKVAERIVRYPQITDLDSLPRPAWDVFAKMPYKWDMEWFTESPVFNMNTSRSCPFNCTFCSVRSIWGKKYTYFSAERVVDDVQHVIGNYGAQGIYFREDNFTLYKKRLKKFCQLMADRGINIPWACESRVSTIDEESIEMMAKVGLRGFYFGVESGSQRMLDLFRKDITVEQIRTAFALCHKYNIKTAASMIVGIPGEREEDLAMTRQLLDEIKPTTIWQNVFVGMPNSQLYKQVLNENLYQLIDDRGLVYLQGHNEKVRKFYGNGPFSKKATMPGNCYNLDMTNKPEISVLICVHNGQRYIRETLESIYNQTFQDFEVIIVDDASTDDTPRIIREMKDTRTFVYRNAENLGPCKSANIGLGLCRSEYVIRSDADDISVADRFQKQLEVIKSDNSLVAVGSWVQWIDENGNEGKIWKPFTEPKQIHNRLMIKNAVAHGSTIIRKSALETVKGYDENFKYSLDYDLWLRLSEIGEIRNIPEPLYKLRAWSGSISAVKRQQQAKLAQKALENACRRRRFPMVTVVTVNYNTLDFTKLCIEKVIQYSDLPFEIIVVDNNSTDGSREFLHQQKGIKLIKLNDNIGHGPALDLAMSYVRSKYTIVIDSDAHPIAPGWMSKMISPLDDQTMASGIHHHRNYVHPACMALETETYFTHKLTFKPNWPKDGDISKLGQQNWDAGEYVSMKLLALGKKLHFFELSNKPEKSIVGSEYGNIVYHHFYGTRLLTEPAQSEFGGVKREDIIKMKDEHIVSGPTNHSASTNSADINPVGNTQTDTDKALKDNDIKLSVVLTTYNRADLLEKVLHSFVNQSCPKKLYEVIVVDDGSEPTVEAIADKFKDDINIIYLYQDNSGLAAARNNGIKCANGEIILFSDDDDIPSPQLIEEHLKSHQQWPDETVAVLGHLQWHKDLNVSLVMDYITGVGGEYFGYSSMQHNKFYPVWKWWGGLISAKKSLLDSIEGPFDQRLRFGYEDTELVCRMLDRDIKILYNANAKSHIVRPVSFEQFCQRRYKQGKALYLLACKHPDIIIKRYNLENASETYQNYYRDNLEKWSEKVNQFETALSTITNAAEAVDNETIQAIYSLFKQTFYGYWLKGFVQQADDISQGRATLSDPVNANLKSQLTTAPLSKLQHNKAQSRQFQSKGVIPSQTKITIISSNTPVYEIGSSNVRIFEMLKIFVQNGYIVDYIYYNRSDADQKYIDMFGASVNFRHVDFNINLILEDIFSNQRLPDILWLTNLWTPHSLKLSDMLMDYISANCSHIKVVLDTMDFHYKKFARKFICSNNEDDKKVADIFLEYEKQTYPKADLVTVVSEQEKKEIISEIDCNVDTIPNIHSPIKSAKDISQRSDICFIGSFRISHNKDAVIWFLNNIFPLILQKRPDTQFHILGFGNEAYRDIFEKNNAVKVIGSVENAEEAISNYRVFVCPLTYGAGMKGKLGSAAIAKTPIVTTTVGAEGFGFVDGQNCFIADTPELFAERCLQLLNDDSLSRRFAENINKLVLSNFSPEVVTEKIQSLIDNILIDPSNAPQQNSGLKVSIILSAYNAEKFLDESIQSVLSQTMSNWQMFLIDDGSTDSTRDIIKKYADADSRIIPLLFDDNKGPYVRRNDAISRASSDYIVIHDADDIMVPDKLQVFYDTISADKNICVVGSFYRSFLDVFKGVDLTDLHVLPTDYEQILKYFLEFRHAMSHGSAIIRKKVFLDIGLYDTNAFGADAFWFAKLGLYLKNTPAARVINLTEPLVLLRKHTLSQTHQVSLFDPRKERSLYRKYCMEKLIIADKNISAGSDVCIELQKCNCPDFTTKFASQISHNKTLEIPRDALRSRLSWAITLFNEGMYVNLVSILDGIGAAKPDIVLKFMNFSLLKAYAFYALKFYDKSLYYAQLEFDNHKNPAAKAFINEVIKKSLQIDPLQWCKQNASRFNMQLLERLEDNKFVNNNPLVSVIVPAYNSQATIRACIDSVLGQTYQNFDVIVIDDGSTDDTAKIVASYSDERIRYFYQENQGLSGARNTAIDKSSADYIVPLDSDDRMTNDYLSVHINWFRDNDTDLLYCDDVLCDESGNIIRLIKRKDYFDNNMLIRDIFQQGYPVIPFRGMIKKTVFDRIGKYDRSLVMAEDYDILRRFLKAGLRYAHLNSPCYLRTVMPNSLSRNQTTKKAKSHFDVVVSISETFQPEELFPDIDWSKIDIKNKDVYTKMLIAATLISIGSQYQNTQQPIMAEAAYERAHQILAWCLMMEPANQSVRKLIEKCDNIRQNIFV